MSVQAANFLGGRPISARLLFAILSWFPKRKFLNFTARLNFQLCRPHMSPPFTPQSLFTLTKIDNIFTSSEGERSGFSTDIYQISHNFHCHYGIVDIGLHILFKISNTV